MAQPTDDLNVQDASDELDIMVYVHSVWARKWSIVAILILSIAVAFVRTMYLVPEVFGATSTLLPLKETSGGSLAALRALGSVGDLIGGLGTSLGASDKARLVNILSSRTVRDRLASDLGVVPHMLRKTIDKERKSGPSFDLDDMSRIATELVAEHPDIVASVDTEDGTRGILSMTDDQLRALVEALPGIEGKPDDFHLSEIRRQWHRLVERAMADFARGVSVSATRDDLVIIHVEMPESAQMASDVANRAVSLLREYLQDNSLTQARKNREFLDSQVTVATAALQKADQDLEAYKSGNRIVSLPDQLKEYVTRAGQIQAELEAKKIERDVLVRSGTSAQNAKLRATTFQIEALSEQLIRAEKGRASMMNSVSIRSAPRMERELADLMRERVVQETLFTLLVQQAEMARIQEAQDQPSFQVLDAAQPAAKRLRPRRSLDMVLGAALGLLLGLAYAFLRQVLSGAFHISRSDGDPHPGRSLG
ncbi:hypothetical protein FJZ36_05730 [Candidatus Poribacteria bacterium]|nr:hypothetical protein [Candidatus Poribacteria bacterium]